MVDHTSTLKVLGRLLFLRFHSQSSYAINFEVFCKPISLLLLILWTGNVQSAFLTTPDPEVAKLVKHDHLKVGDVITNGYEHRYRASAASLSEIGGSRAAGSHAPVLQQRHLSESLVLLHPSNSKLYERNHVLRI
jgi:hypothetical protein